MILFSSRAQTTLEKVLEGIDQKDLPVEKTWRLNERHYGALTGLNKAETAEKHGEEQVSTRNSQKHVSHFISKHYSSKRVLSGSNSLRKFEICVNTSFLGLPRVMSLRTRNFFLFFSHSSVFDLVIFKLDPWIPM